MAITITTPTKADWEGFKNLRLEALKNDPYAFGAPYELEAKMSDEEWKKRTEKTIGDTPEELLFFAKDNTNYIGMIGAFRKSQNVWNIKAVYVTPQYRRTGVSHKLVETMLRRIDSNKNIETVLLSVNAVSEAAVKLYKKFGFVVYDTIENYTFGDGKKYNKYEMKRVKH